MLKFLQSMSYKSIRQWPENERPRERLMQYGSAYLSDAQLLAILLRTGGGGKSALDLALELLHTFKSLKNIESASLAEFKPIKGVGMAKIAQIKAAFELGRRLSGESYEKGPAFSSAHDVFQFYQQRMRALKKEVFCGALLDAKNRIVRDYKVSEGTLTNSLIHPREAFREAIKEAAASVIFVHNHPSGDPAPSREDINITERLVQAGDIVGIKVLDHIIIGENTYTSMMEKGYIKNKQ
jgi:DNA repair protein RadC